MTVRIEDADFSRMLLRETIADVRKMRPGIKVSQARFNVYSSTNGHGQRWMTFEFEGVKVEGYFWNAYEGRIAGWDRWLAANGEQEPTRRQGWRHYWGICGLTHKQRIGEVPMKTIKLRPKEARMAVANLLTRAIQFSQVDKDIMCLYALEAFYATPVPGTASGVYGNRSQGLLNLQLRPH